MKTRKLILLTLGCLAASPILNSCKVKIIEPDTDQKKDTTNISVSRIPKKVITYGRSRNFEICATCKQEQVLTCDAQGNLVKSIHTFYDGTSLTKQEETTYEWNNGKLVKETITGILPSSAPLITTYLYNAQNKIVKISGPESTTNYLYSPEGKLITKVSDQDSVIVTETDSSLHEYQYRRHHANRSWVPSVEHTYTKSRKAYTMHEIGYGIYENNEISVFTESTNQENFSDIPYPKQLQILFSHPSDHEVFVFDYFISSSTYTTTWEGETTTEQCTNEIILDKFKRVKNWKLPCQEMNVFIEY